MQKASRLLPARLPSPKAFYDSLDCLFRPPAAALGERSSCLARLDALSEQMCLVGDVCSALADLHPSPSLREQARALSLELGSAVQEVNVSADIANELKSSEIIEGDEEAARVRAALVAEFTWDGAFLPPDVRERVSVLQNTIRPLELSLLHSPNRPSQQIDLLVQHRRVLAKTLGFKSYAHLACSKCTLNSPEAARELIAQVNEALPPLEQVSRHLYTPATLDQGINLSPQDVVKGLGSLFLNVFGLVLEPSQSQVAAYDASVIELSVREEASGNEIGALGLDLLPRLEKGSGPCVYPLKYRLEGSKSPAENLATCIVAMDLKAGHESLRTLMHEVGHALQHLASHTRFQHLAGTRGPMDLVEVPSLALERMSWDPSVVALFAPGATGLEALAKTRRARATHDLHAQVRLAALDLDLFGPEARPFEEVWPQSLRGATPHLLGPYGGCYWVYLLAQCVAGEVFSTRLGAATANPEDLARLGRNFLEHTLKMGGTARLEDFLLRPPNLKQVNDGAFAAVDVSRALA